MLHGRYESVSKVLVFLHYEELCVKKKMTLTNRIKEAGSGRLV